MKKIEFKKDQDKKKRRNRFILGGLLIFIMFSSTIGYAFQSFGGSNSGVESNETETFDFNGFEFEHQAGFWVLDFYGTNMIFRYNPSEIFNLNSEINPLLNYEARPLYIYSENVNAESEVKTNLFSFVDVIENACFGETENCEDQIKTCEDNFVIIRENISRGIRQEENCVFVEGKKDDLTKLTDEFLYKILGVV